MRSMVWVLLLWVGAAVAEPQPPRLARLYPLGGQAGTTVSLEILGERLSNVTGVEFDCQDLVWKQTTFSSPHRLVGDVAISPSAALGLHTARVQTLDGLSNSGLVNVTSFRNAVEVEPNDKVDLATAISSFPVDIQGRLDQAPDIDIFSFKVGAGQRLVFDLKSIEDGSAVEARMLLLDGAGKRIAFNDDRDDYNENPLIEHVFSERRNVLPGVGSIPRTARLQLRQTFRVYSPCRQRPLGCKHSASRYRARGRYDPSHSWDGIAFDR